MKFLTAMIPTWFLLIEMAVAALAAYWMGWRDGRKATAKLDAKKEHEHKSSIVAVQHTKMNDGPFSPGGDMTLVLYRCETCGAVESRPIRGNWNLEQLTGPASARAAAEGFIGSLSAEP